MFLRDEIQQTFEHILLWQGCAQGSHSLQMIFYSKSVFPLGTFQKLTSQITDPTLRISVDSSKKDMDYTGHFRYKENVWRMKPDRWETIRPDYTTECIISVGFTRKYTYTEKQIRSRLGKNLSSNLLLRTVEATTLAWEDLRKDFRQNMLTPVPQTFSLNVEINRLKESTMEATSA